MADDDDDDKKAQQVAQQKAKQEQQAQQSVTGVPTSQIPIPAPPAAPPATPPVVPAAIPNPLTVGSTFDAAVGSSGAPTPVNPAVMRPVDVAANRYRDIASTGTPEEKAQALADYKSIVQYKPPSIAERYDPQKWADFDTQQREKYMATGKDRWLDSPFTIGSNVAQLRAGPDGIPGSAGMQVTPLREVAEGATIAAENARKYNQAKQDVQSLEADTFDLHGRRQRPSEAALAQAQEKRKYMERLGSESGLVNPEDAKAGLDIGRATSTAIMANRLRRDPSTLTAISTTQPPQPTVDNGAGDLNAVIAKNQILADQAARELARKRALMAGNLSAAYS